MLAARILFFYFADIPVAKPGKEWVAGGGGVVHSYNSDMKMQRPLISGVCNLQLVSFGNRDFLEDWFWANDAQKNRLVEFHVQCGHLHFWVGSSFSPNIEFGRGHPTYSNAMSLIIPPPWG